MTFEAVWALVKDAGPLAIAAVFAVVWWLERLQRAQDVTTERTRADAERKINEDRSTKFYEMYVQIQVTITQFNNTLDKALELIVRKEKGQ